MAAAPTTKLESGKQEAPVVSGWAKWIIAFTVALAAMLEIVDTSIVNVALPSMQGNLGATLSEIGWVVTGYTVANAVIIPLTAWLGDMFGRRGYFIFSLIGFTAASILCGFAWDLPSLVVSRILQGLFGGGLLAKAQAVLFETFPPHEQGLAQALFGVSVIVGPVLGPTLGGYLTDTLGWRWIFFINLPIGIAAVTMAWLFLPEYEKPKKQTKIDWIGVLLLIVAVGSVQTFLEEGNQEDWFASSLIVTLAITSVIGLILFIWRELKIDHPAVDLKILRHKSLAAGSLYSIILGMGLYGAMFAVPVFAQNLLHYTAMQTGLLMLPGALMSGFMMPILGKLTNKVDLRILIGIGAVATSISMFQMASINPSTGADALFWPLLLRGAAMAFMFLPLSMATLSPLPKQNISAASGFYNLTRQLGGSLGVALLTTILSQREAFHRSVLSEAINSFNPVAVQRIEALTGTFLSRGFDLHAAQQMAMSMLNGTLSMQAAILSFADIFWMVGIMFIATMPLLFFLSKGGGGAKPINAH